MVTCPPNPVTQSTSVRLTGTPQDALCRPITTYPNRRLPPTKPIYSINWHSNTVASGGAKACPLRCLNGGGGWQAQNCAGMVFLPYWNTHVLPDRNILLRYETGLT